MNAFFFQNRFARTLASVSIIAVLSGCAHSQMNEAVNKKLEDQPGVATNRELTARAEATISTSQALNQTQKNQLLDLLHSTHDKLAQVADDSLRLRELLISEIAQPKYSDDEVSVIKDRLKRDEDKKLSLIFGAVDDANKILGHNPDRNRQILRVFSSLPVEAL